MQEQLAEWIGTDPIAEEIVEVMDEEGITPTFENASKIWLDFLEHKLADAITSSAQALIDRQEVQVNE